MSHTHTGYAVQWKVATLSRTCKRIIQIIYIIYSKKRNEKYNKYIKGLPIRSSVIWLGHDHAILCEGWLIWWPICNLIDTWIAINDTWIHPEMLRSPPLVRGSLWGLCWSVGQVRLSHNIVMLIEGKLTFPAGSGEKNQEAVIDKTP